MLVVENFDWKTWLESLDKLSLYARSLVLRSLLNAWTTSWRIPVGKDRLMCLFCGRDGLDQLAHAITCTPLLGHAKTVAQYSANMSPLAWLGVTNDLYELQLAAFLGYYYHVVKQCPHHADRLVYHIKAFNAPAKTYLVFEALGFTP